MRVIRVLEYVGPLDMVQKHLGRRLLDSRSFNSHGGPETTVVIREVCCGWPYPLTTPYEIAGYHKPTDARGGGAYQEDPYPDVDDPADSYDIHAPDEPEGDARAPGR